MAPLRRRPVQVAIIERRLFQRLGLTSYVQGLVRFTVVFSGDDAHELLERLESEIDTAAPGIAFFDPVDAGAPDLTTITRLNAAGLRVIVLADFDHTRHARSVLAAGARALVSPRDREEDVLNAMSAVVAGRSWVTPRLTERLAVGEPAPPKLSMQEERALVLYSSGLTIGQVAEQMNIGWETARQYLDRVKLKFRNAGTPVRTKADLIRVAIRDGFIQ